MGLPRPEMPLGRLCGALRACQTERRPVFHAALAFDEIIPDIKATIGPAHHQVLLNWVKSQIERARLMENRDFVSLPQKGEGPGSPPRVVNLA